MQIFANKHELVQHAQQFLSGRLKSLLNDVNKCLDENTPGQPAPFPALLYCFSTIDLLGSLYCGHATSRKKECNRGCRYSERKNNRAMCKGISSRSRKYMENFMNYSAENALLIQNIFRHKLVHLAQPEPITTHDNKKITWFYDHDNKNIHMKLEEIVGGLKQMDISSIRTHKVDHRFCISIRDFVKDIVTSVELRYLLSLKNNTLLQNNYDIAISQIYE